MSQSRARLALLISMGVGLAGLILLNLTSHKASAPPDHGPAAYVGSESCKSCHDTRYDSWHRTFHRTMTQAAGPLSVKGDFNDASYTFRGVTSHFTHKGDRYFIETLANDGTFQSFPIAMTVGSRRIQQYVAQVGDRHIRLPLAWDIEAGRWFHLNGGFLHPDGSDFNTHTALWDANCIFCHNVKAQPRFDPATNRFDSRVAELGIACEACHGPGGEHEKRNRNPIDRYLLHTERNHPTMISPLEQPKERQVQICGHCHGQRTPNPITRIQEFMTTGDPYTAGDDLSRYTSPIWSDTHHEGTALEQTDFSLRFWPDGTPRLTAYEYQGILESPCYLKGEMTCSSCHSMHAGDVRGQITDAKRGPAACISCHKAIGADIPAHTKHAKESAGSDCYACHMPPIVYGIRGIHPSHRIQNPDPSRAWKSGMPEACTLCHTNRTATWAATEMRRQYGDPVPDDLPPGASGGTKTSPWGVAESVHELLGGDVVQRAVAAAALGSSRSYTTEARARLWAVPFLTLALDDDYPGIRYLAARSLDTLAVHATAGRPELSAGLAGIPAFDPLADPAEREAAVTGWRRWWNGLDKAGILDPGSSVPLNASMQPMENVVDDLRRTQKNTVIAIGE